MKKLMILLAVACLIFASCCGNKTEKAIEPAEETCTLTEEQQLMFENWENWDEFEGDKAALVAEMKAFLDECKAKCEAKKECKKEDGEEKEICPEKKAKCEEFKAKWEAFEELELDAQKELIDMKLAHIAKCCKDKKEGCCKKDKEEVEEVEVVE